VREILQISSMAVHHLGDVGAGMTMKLAANALFATQVAALGETLGVLQKASISVERSVRLICEIPTTSPALKGTATLIASDNFAPLFPIHLVEKDLGYFEKLAESMQAAIPAARTARDAFQLASEAGYSKDNVSGIARMYL
jgi:3-hydroxyisobutyrate dehydrogenase-like beta-hydroxyacid dehydrogenase